MYWFFIAAIINYLKFDSSNKHKSMLQVGSSEVLQGFPWAQNLGVSRLNSFLEEYISWLFPASADCLNSLGHVSLAPSLKSAIYHLSDPAFIFIALSLTTPGKGSVLGRMRGLDPPPG